MARRGRSARGDIIDFDLIAIRQQLAESPPSVVVDARRNYIDTKDGITKKDSAVIEPSVSIGTEDLDGNDDPLPVDFVVPTDDNTDAFDLVNG